MVGRKREVANKRRFQPVLGFAFCILHFDFPLPVCRRPSTNHHERRIVYWTENGKISQSNLDGTAVETLVSGKTTRYSSLEIFPPPE